MTQTYRDWPVHQDLPDGWQLDRNAGSPLAGHSFATDGKSVLNGGKRALVRVVPVAMPPPVYQAIEAPAVHDHKPLTAEGRRAMNDLARAKFKEQLIKDLTCDLMVCKIENWDHREYIAELHTLIDGLHESIHPKQPKLFGGFV